MNFSSKRTRASVGLPGTGLGYTATSSSRETENGPTAPTAPGVGSSLTGCLGLLLGMLLFGGCILGSCQSCIRSRPPEEVRTAAPVVTGSMKTEASTPDAGTP